MDDVFKKFLDGDDVPTLIGAAGVQLPSGVAKVALILVDYSEMPQEKDRTGYTEFFEELWDKDYFADGFDLSKTSETAIRVSSRRIMAAIAFGDGEEHHLKAPSYYADCLGDLEFIKDFEDLRAERGLWLLHLRTLKWSYLYLVRHPSNSVISRTRNPKQELTFNPPT